jgi:lactate permease
MAVAYITNYSGASSTIGLALAETGGVFPVLSPVIGWMGVFITGSVVNSNTLFAHLQAVTAEQIGVAPALLVAANTAGGVMAKLVSPQSIAIAAAAVKLVGQESAILRSTLAASLGLLAYVCVVTWVLSMVA